MTTTTTKCPVCEKTFPTQLAMRQHFNEKHRAGTTAQALDEDAGPDSLHTRGSVPRDRCGNCLYWGRANNIMVCRLHPGEPGMAQGAGGIAVPVCFLPPKFANDWCGSHVRGAWPVEAEPAAPGPTVS
jgi:hypothetical protein